MPKHIIYQYHQMTILPVQYVPGPLGIARAVSVRVGSGTVKLFSF